MNRESLIRGKAWTKLITVRVRTFAGLRETLGFSDTEVTLPAGADVAGLVARLTTDYPAANLSTRRYTAAVNRRLTRRRTECWLRG